MSLLVHPRPDGDGVVVDVTPASAGWTYVGFRVVRLAAGRRYEGVEADREACLVLLTGTADVLVDGMRFDALGGRESAGRATTGCATSSPG